MGSVGVVRNSRTMVCVPLMSEYVEKMVGDMYEAKVEGADMVELRLDCLKHFQPKRDLPTLLSNKPLPVVVVYRPKCDGGLYEGDEKSRLEALLLAKDLGAEYIDLELQVAFDIMEEHKLTQQNSCKIIVSCFVDGETSLKEDLSHLVTRMQSTGADIIKLVTNATDITELSRIFHLLTHCQVPLIAYSTGERGLISQLLSPKFGGVLVYGSIEGNQLPGLPTLASLKEAYAVENIDADTKVYGLISKPVSHSKGPILHNPTFRHVGYNGVYVPMFVDDLKQFFNVYESPDFAGYSVGIPYKEAVMEFCDEVHPLAQSIGAVNTIVKRHSDGKLVGYNTDCEASITAIEDALKARGLVNGEASLPSPLTGKQFVLVGAGGAGRALSFGAKSRGARVTIFDIDYERAKSLALAVSGEALPFEQLATFQPEKGAVLANATPIGMHPSKDRIPVSEDTLRDYSVVFDAVYTPRKTTLLRDSEAAGAIIVSGVEMFLRQAVGQFNLFTGGKAPEEFMREIVLSKF
ncbi:3-dehydroquinate dehydratase type I [Artemisia annua]|uniref:3-dehydroquinate dehydratase type I n=1 Tax=Artemisia annua TaxID=35608 RepID=A0A2U1PTH3_ARTAN|nr:3-dehydroquinate dehydratase type I [Artemisia annua]